MDFALSPEQQDFQRHLRQWVDKKLPKDAARAWEAKEHHYPHEVWDLMSEQGLHAIGLPEEYGGTGPDVISQVIVGRELSRTLGGMVWIWGLSSFCARSIAESGSAELKQDLLPRLAEGEPRSRSPSPSRRVARTCSVPWEPARARSMGAGASPGRRYGPPGRTCPTTCCSWPARTPR